MEDNVYVLVSNIPQTYHSSDLRNYFSQFLERGLFDCFHFRHRPEQIKCRSEGVASASLSDVKTCCCVVKLNKCHLQELIKMYNRKCWLNRRGESIKSLCRIFKITVSDQHEDGSSRYKTRAEVRSGDDPQLLSRANLLKLPELHPPALMPHGNVGTTTAYFLQQIQCCRLPSSIISKLGLVFARTRSKRIYGSVPFAYSNTDTCPGSTGDDDAVRSGRGEEIISEKELGNTSGQTSGSTNSEKCNDENDEAVDVESESDNDECEEWERHEAFHDDPSNQGRNSERLYESEMEIVWEKGGPGIVWYTDAQFWDELDGTEEEKDTDEWDIDMSVYYDPNGGDKDAVDMLTMRRDTRRREGRADDDDVVDTVIGKFERYSKGFGSKLMKKYGWEEGQGLGSSVRGIVNALDDEGGQKPHDKRGFGYHGEKLEVFGGGRSVAKRPKLVDNSIFKISTIYDDTEVTDPPSTLLRRTEPTQLKHRNKFS